MSITATIRAYFTPLAFSAREEREANRTVAEANKQATLQLLADERRYLEGELTRAVNAAARQSLTHQLAEINELEIRAHG
jgi:hypothetical protein